MSNLTPWPDLWKGILALHPIILDGCELAPSEEGWISIFCPIHTEQKPSLRVNIETGGIKCMAGCDVGRNLNDLEDLILDRPNLARRGKRPKDVVGDLAERRLLPRDWLIDTFGIEAAPGGYSIPIDDPEADPDIEIDYEIDGLTKRIRYWIVKRGEWIDKDATTRPKYRWEPKLSTSGVKAKDLVYNLHRVLPRLPKEKLVYVCAGPPDVWVMMRAGFPAISFLAGEGNVPTPRAIDKLLQAGIKEAIIIYDRDEAGEEGSEKLAIALAQAGLSATTRELPEDLGHGGDLSDLWRRCEGDGDAFEKVLANTPTKVWPAEDASASDYQRAARARIRQAKPTLPEECWVEPWESYRQSLLANTAACGQYHFFALMNIIGAIFGRRAFVYAGRRLYPNQYTALIGPTHSFKSTANARAIEVVEALYDKENEDRLPGTKLTIEQATGSAEGLIEAAAFADAEGSAEFDAVKVMMGWKEKTAEGQVLDEEDLAKRHERRLLIHQDEFCRLLSKANSGGSGASFIPHLLTSFDCPKEIRLRTRKRPIILVNAVTSILADSTLAKLSQHFDEIEWTSGFGNRIIFVDGSELTPLPRTQPPTPNLWQSVIDHIREAYCDVAGEDGANYGVEFALSTDAEAVWDVNYLQWMDSRQPLGEEELAATERVGDYAMKFALIYALMTPNHRNTIVGEDVNLAWLAARYAERVTLGLMGSLIEEKQARWQEQIKAYIAGHQPVQLGQLQQHFKKIPAPALNLLIDNLERLAVIKKTARGVVLF